MCLKKLFNWCKENYQTLLAIGALLGIITFLIQIINSVGITINIPLYFQYFDNLSTDAKIYSLAVLNFIFTISVYLILTNKTKKKKKTSKK